MLCLAITSRKLAAIRQEAKNRITALGFQIRRRTTTVSQTIMTH